MLNFNICLKCCLANLLEPTEEEVRYEELHFKHDWYNYGMVMCYYKEYDGSQEYTSIKEIPKECPYILEHTVTKDESPC